MIIIAFIDEGIFYILLHLSLIEDNAQPVMYPGRLGDRYNGLGIQTLAPKKRFLSLLFSIVFQQK